MPAAAVIFQYDREGEIVEGLIDFVDGFVVKCFYAGDSCLHETLLQQAVCDTAEKDPEDVADSKVHPDRARFSFLCSFYDIVAGQSDAGGFPGAFVPNPFQC